MVQSTTSNQLDPQAVTLAKAIRQTESGGNFTAQGKSGEYGAYQYTEPTWEKDSQQAGVNVSLEQATPEQQNEVAYKKIKQWKDQGYNVGQIASMWNAGEGKPNAYLDGNSGTNKFGVQYDTAKYAKSVADAYQKIKSGGQVQADPNNPSSTAAPQPQQDGAPSIGGFLGNFFSSAGNFAGGIGNAVLHPIDTAENLGRAALGVGEQAYGGITGQPINDKNTQIAGNIESNFDNRYGVSDLLHGDLGGTVNKIGNTFYKDPVGAAADASMLLGGAGGALSKISDSSMLGNFLTKTGEALNPLAIPGKIVGKTSDILADSANKNYSDALAATTKQDKFLTKPIVEGRDVNLPSGEQVHVPGLIERGVKGGLGNISDTIDKNLKEVGGKYDEANAALPADVKVTVKPILDQIENAKKEFTIKGENGMVVADPQAVQHLTDFQDTIQKLSSEGLVSKESLDQLKQLWQAKVAKSGAYYGKTLAEGSQVDMLSEAEKAIRRQLDTQFPDIAKLNAEYKFWKDAEKVVNDTMLRKTGQSGIVSKIGWGAVGAISGSPFLGGFGGLAGASLGELAREVFTSAAWKTTSAVVKSRLSQAILSGNASRIGTILQSIVPASRVNSLSTIPSAK